MLIIVYKKHLYSNFVTLTSYCKQLYRYHNFAANKIGNMVTYLGKISHRKGLCKLDHLFKYTNIITIVNNVPSLGCQMFNTIVNSQQTTLRTVYLSLLDTVIRLT